MISKELVQGRIHTLKQQQADSLANYHAVTGAIQDCEYWLFVISEGKDDNPDSTGDDKV